MHTCKHCQRPLIKKVAICPHCHTDQRTIFTSCPICASQSSFLVAISSRLAGLIKVTSLTCPSCSAVFEEHKNGFRLLHIPSSHILLMGKYVGKTFPASQWKGVVQKEQDLEKFHHYLKQGITPTNQHGLTTRLLLQNDEQCIITIPIILLCEPKTVRVGNNNGMSFRVARGAYYRTGVSKSYSYQEVKPSDAGEFTLTNKRISFFGKTRSITIPLKKITSLQPYVDNERPTVAAIALTRDGNQKPLYFEGFDQATMTIPIEGRTYFEKITGIMMISMIEGLRTKSETDTKEKLLKGGDENE